MTAAPSWDGQAKVLTLTGTNLKGVTDVKLKPQVQGAPPAQSSPLIKLDIDPTTTDVLLLAKEPQGNAVAPGTYDVLVDGKPINQPPINVQ